MMIVSVLLWGSPRLLIDSSEKSAKTGDRPGVTKGNNGLHWRAACNFSIHRDSVAQVRGLLGLNLLLWKHQRRDSQCTRPRI